MIELFIKTYNENDLLYASDFLHKGDLFFQHVNVYKRIEDNNIRGDINDGIVVKEFQLKIPKNVRTVHIGSPPREAICA